MNPVTRRAYSIFFKKSNGITKLGRWAIVEDQETMDLKIDRANHDSCGGPLCTSVPLKEEKKSPSCVEESEEEELLRYYTVGSFHLHVKKE